MRYFQIDEDEKAGSIENFDCQGPDQPSIGAWAIVTLFVFRTAEFVAVIAAVGAFVLELMERPAERRARAWQILTTPAPGNSGKVEALQYLSRGDQIDVGRLGGESLRGIDLSPPRQNSAGTYLRGLSLVDADVSAASFERADLRGATFEKVFLDGTNFRGAMIDNVRFANVSGSNIVIENVTANRVFFDCDNCQFSIINSRLTNPVIAGNPTFVFADAIIEYGNIYADRININGDSVVFSETTFTGGALSINVKTIFATFFAERRIIGADSATFQNRSAAILQVVCDPLPRFPEKLLGPVGELAEAQRQDKNFIGPNIEWLVDAIDIGDVPERCEINFSHNGLRERGAPVVPRRR